MYQVSCRIDFCYGHRLLEYAGKCRYLHGHNGRAVITLAAEELDGLGMVLDFTEIKQVVNRWIDENLDHRMILCERDPAIVSLRAMGEPMFVIPRNPTAENIARLIYDFASGHGFPVIQVQLWETARCCATYGPSAQKKPGGS